MANSVTLHRVLATTPEKIYRAFLTPEAMAKWLPPDGYTATFDHLDARVGGTFRATFTSFATARGHSFGGEYLELVPDRLIRYTDRFEDPGLPGTMTVTVKIEQVSCGADLTIVQSGIPEAIPVEMCYLGWQQSLEALKRLVEAETGVE